MTDRGVWMQTRTGRAFYPQNPLPEDICIEDIAHALGNLCRFGGHTKRFYCPTPDQRVLTAALEWKPAGDIRVGDELLGFDEQATEPGSSGKARRRYRHAVVTHAEPVRRRIVRLEMADGSTVRASEEHPWLVAAKASRSQAWLPSARIAEDVAGGRRRYMHKFIEPWAARGGWDDGWFSGILDGEGHLSFINRGGVQGGFAQKPGAVLDHALSVLASAGAPAPRLFASSSGVVQAQFVGGRRGVAGVLGAFRPRRLIDNFVAGLRSGAFAKQMEGVAEPLEIVRAWVEGEEEVAGLETSTRTYLCEGYGAHNSVAEHSVHVSTQVPPEHALQALLHDATEAYLVDVPKPIKPLLIGYAELEAKVWAAVAAHFEVPAEMHPAVHAADVAVLLAEKDQLLGPGLRQWYGTDIQPARLGELPCYAPREAKYFFLRRFTELIGARHKDAA